MVVKGGAYHLHLGDALCLPFIPLGVSPVKVKEEYNQSWHLLAVFQQPPVLEDTNWGVVIVADTLKKKKKKRV